MQFLNDVIIGPLPALGRLLLIAPLTYLALVVLLRATGKRSLAKLNAFDFIITIALGSTLASTITSASVSLAQGVLSLVLLLALQFVVSWLSVRVRGLRRAVRAEPALLVRDGHFLDDQLTAQRVSRAEVFQAMRSSGCGGLDLVAAVVLETDGTLSVVTTSTVGCGDALSPTGWHEEPAASSGH